MKRTFVNLETAILAGVAIIVFYLLSIIFDLRLGLILGLFLLSITATLWIVIEVLRDPYSTDKTFDNYFYADRDDLRPTDDTKRF